MSEIRTGCNDSCPYYYENTGCFKPEGLFCPPKSTTINDGSRYSEYTCGDYIITTEATYKTVRNCIICGKSTSNAEEMICDECKDAILWLKEFIGKNDE